ncbi:MAG TPA: cyclase family protein [Methylomirabilota bacterium]|jgi:kynurenine formamidase|nr:cyclase family protein [Methylomirabilota bacterium]
MQIRLAVSLVIAVAVLGLAVGTSAQGPGWVKGKGYGWIWGQNDEIGALNMLTPQRVMNALKIPKQGKVYDLGVLYDRASFQWPGHSPAEVISFRTPEGLKRQKDLAFLEGKVARWHSNAVFINDNVGTQIDSLCHITVGDDDHWYNGYKEKDWGGNFGPRKACADKMPPIVTRGVLIDVAGLKGQVPLPTEYEITPDDLKAALSRQGIDVQPGDAVFVRTGIMSLWGEAGHDKAKLAPHDSAGINVAAAKFLVEEKGAILIGADTSGLECTGKCWKNPGDFYPVHVYLLAEQGVYIGEFHNLEELAQDRAYEFLYMNATSKLRGATAGFVMRPAAIR